MQCHHYRGVFFVWTKSFETSLLEPSSKGKPDCKKKEEYALHFMLLFVPFQTFEDLLCNGSHQKASHQKAFQKARKDGRITDEMIQIAENIQTIHNSLASGIPENTLLPKHPSWKLTNSKTQMKLTKTMMI
jgi:hypothetical protein